MNKRLKTSRYITGFDGIRTLAVIGVILYHLLPTQMRGGYLGVPVFCSFWLFDHRFASTGVGPERSYCCQRFLCPPDETTVSWHGGDAASVCCLHYIVPAEFTE